MQYEFKIALSFATEEQELVNKVYHYLKAENVQAFFAPSAEGQTVLSGKNQREIFYSIFGLKSEYVALFVSKNYIAREVPMEEASIAFSKHSNDGTVIPIYLDETVLPIDMLDPKKINYFKSNDPIAIANHLATKIKQTSSTYKDAYIPVEPKGIMNNKNNTAEKQIFIQQLDGSINL